LRKSVSDRRLRKQSVVPSSPKPSDSAKRLKLPPSWPVNRLTRRRIVFKVFKRMKNCNG